MKNLQQTKRTGCTAFVKNLRQSSLKGTTEVKLILAGFV